MGLCVFNDEWIIEYPWIRRDARSIHHAHCQLCHKTFSIGGQGGAAVKSHAKGTKHDEREKSRKTLNMDTFIDSTKKVSESISDNKAALVPSASTSSKQPSSSNSKCSSNSNTNSSASSSTSGIQTFFNKKLHENVLHAEILWMLNSMESHYSHKSQEKNTAVFKVMFHDSAIAQNYSCAETKARYMVTYGMAPAFKTELCDKLKAETSARIGFIRQTSGRLSLNIAGISSSLYIFALK